MNEEILNVYILLSKYEGKRSLVRSRARGEIILKRISNK
jgi:hypothetical protein